MSRNTLHLYVPDELHAALRRHYDVNWSQVFRDAAWPVIAALEDGAGLCGNCGQPAHVIGASGESSGEPSRVPG